jgi:rubredoxin
VLECPKCGALEHIRLDDEGDQTQATHDSEQTSDDIGEGGKTLDSSPTDSPALNEDVEDGPVCPKCGAPRMHDEACSKCGLIFARWRDDEDAKTPEEAAKLWEQLQDQWDDETRHQQFLSLCLDMGALSYAARCYRGRDDDIAKAQLSRLTSIGVQAMQAAERPSRLNPKIFRTVGWTLFFLLCGVLLIVAFSVR